MIGVTRWNRGLLTSVPLRATPKATAYLHSTSHISKYAHGEKLGLTFTEMLSPKESSILMYRNCAADLQLHALDIDEAYIESAKALLISGTALAESPSREAAIKAVLLAKRTGTKIIFDIDYRAYSWKNDDEISIYYSMIAKEADIIMGSTAGQSVYRRREGPVRRNDSESMMRSKKSVNQKNKIAGTLLVLTAAVLWGSSFAVRKMGMSDIGPLMQNTMRFFAAFCFMLLMLVIRNAIGKPGRNKYKMPISRQIKYGILIGAAFGTAAMLQQIGLITVSAGKVGFLTSLYTVLVPIMSRIFFHNKVSRQVWAGMMLSFVGLVFVTNGSMGFEIGFVILFMGAIMYALQIILIGRYIKDADPMVLVTIQVFMGTIVNLAMAVITQEAFAFTMVKDALIPILYTGIFSLGVANLCQFSGQKKIQPSITAIICSFESVFGLLFGILLLGESLSLIQGLGCGMIFFAVIVSQMEKKH